MGYGKLLSDDPRLDGVYVEPLDYLARLTIPQSLGLGDVLIPDYRMGGYLVHVTNETLTYWPVTDNMLQAHKAETHALNRTVSGIPIARDITNITQLDCR